MEAAPCEGHTVLPINLCTNGINVSLDRGIIWKSDFSEDYEPESVVYWFYVRSERNTFMKVTF
jgi:hypothetical protein